MNKEKNLKSNKKKKKNNNIKEFFNKFIILFPNFLSKI